MKFYEKLLEVIYFWIPFIIAGLLVWGGFALLLFTPIYFYFYEPDKFDSLSTGEWVVFGLMWWIMFGGLLSIIIGWWEKNKKRKKDE